jgi:hypothetical protein
MAVDKQGEAGNGFASRFGKENESQKPIPQGNRFFCAFAPGALLQLFLSVYHPANTKDDCTIHQKGISSQPQKTLNPRERRKTLMGKIYRGALYYF